MAEEKEIVTVFKADISNFTKSTKDLNLYVKTVNSEFKNATASMGKWSDNTDGLQAKLKQLNGTLQAEEKKLSSLEEEYKKLAKEGKENTLQAKNLNIKILDQKTKVEQTKTSIKQYSDSLGELQKAGVKTTKELEKLNKKNDELKENAKSLASGVLKGVGVGIAGIATACVGALAGLNNLVEETKELRTQMGQLETTFETQGLSVENAKNTYNELFGVLGDSGKATEASLHLGNLAKNEKELSDYTNILTGVYATFGDSLPVEGLAEAMNHTANLGSVQGNLADALEWSGINVDDFNEQLATLSTEEERANLINSTLNGIYGESAEKYREVNGEVIKANEAQNKYNQAMADIAEKAQPAITSFKLAMVEVLQTILAKFQEVDIEGLITKISDTITTLVNVALPPLMSAITWVLDNLNWLVPVLGSVGGLITAIVGGIKLYNAVTKIASAVQIAFNLALSANPIGLVIIAVAGLVAGFTLLWTKCEGFRNFFIKMWEGIKSAVKNAGDFISGIFSSIGNTIKGVFNGIISAINGAINAINRISVTVPDWVPEFGGKKFGFNLSTIPLLAKGGIVDKPTLAMVGEAGKEAVMPLENNTQWIDKLAEKLSGMMNSSQNVTNNFNYTFEKMETSRIALHKAQLETKRIIGG